MERGWEEKTKREDRLQWIWGRYTESAVATALARVMRGDKNAKYIDKPVLTEFFDDLHLTEQEIADREIMQIEAWLSG